MVRFPIFLVGLIGIAALLGVLWLTTPAEPKEMPTSRPLRINIYSEPPTLDPRKAYDVTSGTVLLALFDGLVRIGLNGEPQLAVAERVSVSEDMRHFTFYLRRSQWNNGDPVTAYDFAESWRTILRPDFPGDFAQQLFVIRGAREAKMGELPIEEVGITTSSPYLLEVELEHPTPYFLALCASYPYLPVHHQIAEANPKWADRLSEEYVSNGPFRLARWKHGDSILVERNESYWDAEQVHLPAIEMTMIDDERTELLLFQRGELDWAGTPISSLPYDALPSLRRRGMLHSVPVGAVYWYKLETSHYPISNPKIRRALALAMNREEIVRYITIECHQPATHLLPPSLGLEYTGPLLEYHPEMAKQLFDEGLQELGLDRTLFPPITISFNESEEHRRIAQAVQAQWQEALEIPVELASQEWRVHLSNLTHHNYQVARQTWIASVEDPIDILQLFEERNDPEYGGNNDTSWADPDYSALLAQAREESDAIRRTALLQQAEELFMREMPLIPIFFCNVNYLIDPRIRDCCLSPVGHLDFKWARFSDEEDS